MENKSYIISRLNDKTLQIRDKAGYLVCLIHEDSDDFVLDMSEGIENIIKRYTPHGNAGDNRTTE